MLKSIPVAPSRAFARRALALASAVIWGLGFGVTANAETREIETAKGVIKVDGEPQRVVVLSEAALDTALALGVKPLGSVATRGSTAVSAYLQLKAGKLAIVGTAREFNLESILALQPDLILAPNAIGQDVYNILSKLAPTIVPAAVSTDDWRKTVNSYAQALGKVKEAEAAYKALDQRIETIGGRLRPGQTVSVVRWMPQGPMIMSSKIFTGQLLTQLGLKTPELANSLGDKPHSDTLSLENLGKVNADQLFLAALNEEGKATMAAARKQAAFERLDVVKSGNVSTVDGQIWTSGTGILAANKVLDDIEKAMLP